MHKLGTLFLKLIVWRKINQKKHSRRNRGIETNWNDRNLTRTSRRCPLSSVGRHCSRTRDHSRNTNTRQWATVSIARFMVYLHSAQRPPPWASRARMRARPRTRFTVNSGSVFSASRPSFVRHPTCLGSTNGKRRFVNFRSLPVF